MADISRLSRLLNGIQRQVALSSNTLVVDNLKIKMGSGNDANHATFTGTLTAARSISMPDANVDLGQIATNLSNISSNDTDIADLVSLSGVAANSTTLGTFTGSTIQDNVAIKTALQDLETQVDTNVSGISSNDTDIADLVSLSGVAVNSTDLGTFSGTTIPDASTVKAAIQSLETAHEETDQNVDDLVSLTGVAENSTDLGIFTGSTIADGSTLKAALQSLELAVEGASAGLTYRGSLSGSADLTGDVTGNTYIDGTDGFFRGDFFKISSDGTLTTSTGTNVAVNTGDMIIINKDVANDGSIADADLDKIDNTEAADILREGDLSAAEIFVGNSSNIATAVSLSGDASLSDTGVLTISADAVTGSKFRLDNDQWLRARNNADSADVNVLKVNASDQIEFSANPVITAYAAPTADAELSPKKYVDDEIAALDSTSFDHTQATPADWTVADGSSVGAHLDELGDRVKTIEEDVADTEVVSREITVGEAMAADTTFAVRWARSGETAGRVYKADNDASSNDNFHAVGFIKVGGTSLTAGDTATMTMMGGLTLASNDAQFTASADEGKPVFLGTSGGFTLTAPTNTDTAVVIVGYVENVGGSSKIDTQRGQIQGVN